MINIFLFIIIIALVYYIFKLKNQLKKIKTQNEIDNKYIPYHINGSFKSNEDKQIELFRILNENKDYDKIDELFGCPWYSTLVKEVDNIINSQKS